MQWNKHVWSLFLHFLTWFQHKPRWKRRLNIKYPFSYAWFLKTKWRPRQLSNVITSPKRHIYACNVFANESIGEMISHGRNAFQCTCNVMHANQGQGRLFWVKVMSKQHVNLMIWTWILRLQTASRNEYPCKNAFLWLDKYVLEISARCDYYKCSFLVIQLSITKYLIIFYLCVGYQTDSPAFIAHVVSKSNILTGCSSYLECLLISLIDRCGSMNGFVFVKTHVLTVSSYD